MNEEELCKIPDLYAKAINYVFENNMVSDDGLWLEFGVYAGGTINRIAAYTTKTVYGFDSFEGLPETWAGRVDANGVTYPKNTFSLGGNLPNVSPNIQLIKGWFKDTLPSFIKDHNEQISFLHIDSDIYSSANDIFNHTYKNLKNGCIIVFDELVEYNGYEEHEWKAWFEFVNKYHIKYEWIGGNKSKIIKPNTNGALAFDHNKLLTENISPACENVAVRIINNPFFNIKI